MSARCDKCWSDELQTNTGEIDQLGSLDCQCGVADERMALNSYIASLGLRHSVDTAWLAHQRAVEQERAKARAELERIMRYYDSGDYKAHEHLRDELKRIAP